MMCAIVLVMVSLTACGRTSTDPPPGVVAEVGHARITKATLNQWMAAILGSDYYETSNKVAPTTLLAPPPDHTSCVVELERLIDKSKTVGKTKRSRLERICAEVYVALKEQALTYLIHSQVSLAEGARYGVVVTNKQLMREFASFQAGQAPTERELQTYLAQRHLTLGNLLFALKQNVVAQEIARKLTASLKGAHPDVKALIARETERVNETTCAPGYVVARCSKYPYFKPGGTQKLYTTEAPAQLLSAIASLQPATSGGRPRVTEDLECQNVGKKLSCKRISRKQEEEELRRTNLRHKHG
jgi:hypothetical protein